MRCDDAAVVSYALQHGNSECEEFTVTDDAATRLSITYAIRIDGARQYSMPQQRTCQLRTAFALVVALCYMQLIASLGRYHRKAVQLKLATSLVSQWARTRSRCRSDKKMPTLAH